MWDFGKGFLNPHVFEIVNLKTHIFAVFVYSLSDSVHGISQARILERDMGFPSGSLVKNPPAGDTCSISGSGRSPEGGNGNPLHRGVG